MNSQKLYHREDNDAQDSELSDDSSLSGSDSDIGDEVFKFFNSAKDKNGLVISLNAYSYLKADSPIPIIITIGYDRPTNKEFLYIEPQQGFGNLDYASTIDGCTYNSMADVANLRAPLVGYYLSIFIKYKIYIPIEIYEKLQNIQYTNPDGKGGYAGLSKDISRRASAIYKGDFEKYYAPFQQLIIDMPYEHPLLVNEINDISGYVWDFTHSVTNALGIPVNTQLTFNSKTLSAEEKIFSQQKNRLILGESNFSFSMAFCKKHPKISSKIIATEYIAEKELKKVHGKFLKDNIAYLHSMSVTIQYEIDATKIHELFNGYHFKYIHFNNPNDRSDYYQVNRTLPILIKKFFFSAYRLQEFGDKVFVALPTHPEKEKQEEREGYIYQIYDAAAVSGYRLVDKKPFNDIRYPGYQHTKTGSNQSAPVAQYCVEYIFKKIEPLINLPDVILYKSPTDEKDFHQNELYGDSGHILPDMGINTDASSDFSDAEDEVDLKTIASNSNANSNATTSSTTQLPKTYLSVLMGASIKSNNASSSSLTKAPVLNANPIYKKIGTTSKTNSQSQLSQNKLLPGTKKI